MKRWGARPAAVTRTAPTPEIAAPGRPGGVGGKFPAEAGRLRAAGASERDVVRGATELLAQRRAQEVEGQAPAAPSTAAGAAPPGKAAPGERHPPTARRATQAPEAVRELVAPSLAMRCRRGGLVVPAPERPGHAARCHVGYDEHEARRWGPI
jgi:hypothetical protein